jgi:hypothetical protein
VQDLAIIAIYLAVIYLARRVIRMINLQDKNRLRSDTWDMAQHEQAVVDYHMTIERQVVIGDETYTVKFPSVHSRRHFDQGMKVADNG